MSDIFDDESNLDVKGYEVSGKYNRYMKSQMNLGTPIIHDIEVENRTDPEERKVDELISSANSVGSVDAQSMVNIVSKIHGVDDGTIFEKKAKLNRYRKWLMVGIVIMLIGGLVYVKNEIRINVSKIAAGTVVSVKNTGTGYNIYVDYSVDGVDYTNKKWGHSKEKLKEGTSINVYYKAKHPDQIFDGKSFTPGIKFLFGLGFIIALVGGVPILLCGNDPNRIAIVRKEPKYYRRHLM